jgi:hypothetical protein
MNEHSELTNTYRRRSGWGLQAEAATAHGAGTSREEGRPWNGVAGGTAGEHGGARGSEQHGRRSHLDMKNLGEAVVADGMCEVLYLR